MLTTIIILAIVYVVLCAVAAPLMYIQFVHDRYAEVTSYITGFALILGLFVIPGLIIRKLGLIDWENAAYTVLLCLAPFWIATTVARSRIDAHVKKTINLAYNKSKTS